MSKLCLFTCIISSIKQNNDPPGFIVIFRRTIFFVEKWRSKKKLFRDSVSWRWKSGPYIGHELYSQSALSYLRQGLFFHGGHFFSSKPCWRLGLLPLKLSNTFTTGVSIFRRKMTPVIILRRSSFLFITDEL